MKHYVHGLDWLTNIARIEARFQRKAWEYDLMRVTLFLKKLIRLIRKF